MKAGSARRCAPRTSTAKRSPSPAPGIRKRKPAPSARRSRRCSALAYLRTINSPADDLAFERIVNVPKRGLGDATVQMLHDHARKRRIPLFEAARAVVETDELKPKARGSLRDLILHFDRWRAQREVTSHTELAEIVLDESGYTEMWQKDRSADAAGRLENLKEPVRSMEEFENLQGFLEHISLVMDRETGAGEQAV